MALPTAVTAPPEELGDGEGTLSASFEAGSLMLRDGAGAHWRLSFGELEGTPEDDDGRRALPAGPYDLVGWRILREDADGTPWHVSTVARRGRKLEVVAGADALVEIDPQIRIESGLGRDRAVFSVLGEGRVGLSIYRDGARIPMGYRTTRASGELIEAGDLEYG